MLPRTSHHWPRWLPGLVLLLLPTLWAAGPARAHEPDEVAITDLTARLSQARSPAHALLVRAELHRAAERWDEAQADLADARTLDPAAPLLDLCGAVLAFERGRPADAVPAFERYLARVPADGAAHAWFARTLLALGRPAEAAARYDSALGTSRRVTPELVLARVALADSLEGPAQALRQVERGLTRVGPSVPLEMSALDLEVRLGRSQAALARLARLEQQGGDPGTLGWHRGEILRLSGHGLDACVAWSEALEALDRRAAIRPLSVAQVQLRTRLRDALDHQLAASAPVGRGGHP